MHKYLMEDILNTSKGIKIVLDGTGILSSGLHAC
jgi:hypothetical protein